MLAVFPSAVIGADDKDFPITPGESCMTASCHADMGKKPYVHLVAADGSMCTICHLATTDGQHGFTMAAEGGDLCAQCHGNKADKKFKHVPVEAGMCTFCHNPHQSDYPKQLNADPPSELCYMCHDRGAHQANVVHGPVAEGQCVACHNPHTSDQPKQLQTKVPELCFGCHDALLKDPEGRPLPAKKAPFEDKTLHAHPPFAAGECLWCHTPHASDNFRLLNSPYPESNYTSFSPDKYICLNCHSATAFTEPRTTTETAFRNGNLNLHYRHVNKEKGRSCRFCHDPHATKYESLIRDEVPFGKRFIKINSFEKTETGGSCVHSCHGKARYDRIEPVLNAVKVTPRKGEEATAQELKAAPDQQTGTSK